MEIKTSVSWALIILSIAVAFCLVAKPLIKKQPIEEVAASELAYIGHDSSGEHWYIVMKEEIKDWFKIISPMIPVILMISGWFISNKKKKEA